MLDALDALGRASLALVWLPLAAWTVLWLASEVVSRLPGRLHPLPRYRATQALLFALPLGLALALLLDPALLVPWLQPPVVVVSALADPPLIVEGATVPHVVPEAPAPVLTLWRGLGLLMGGLGLLAMIQGVRLAMGAATLHRLRRALPTPDPALTTEAGEVARSLGLRHRVEVVASDAVAVPMTFGVWRPVVVLPPSLSDEARRLALGHELAHVLRRDALATWCEAAVVAVFGWHPGVQRLARQCDLLREMVADSTLLSRREVSRPAYAELVSSFVAPPAPTQLVAVGMADSASHVHQRLVAMTHPHFLRKTTGLLGWALAGLLLTSASLAVTASRALAQEKRIEVREIRTSGDTTPPVLVVDGQRHDGGMEVVNTLDVHSVNLLRGEEAETAHGEPMVIEVTTKARAEALGLDPAGTVSASFDVIEGDEVHEERSTFVFRSESDGPVSLESSQEVTLRGLRRALQELELEADDVRVLDHSSNVVVTPMLEGAVTELGFGAAGMSRIEIVNEDGVRAAKIHLPNGEVRELPLTGTGTTSSVILRVTPDGDLETLKGALEILEGDLLTLDRDLETVVEGEVKRDTEAEATLGSSGIGSVSVQPNPSTDNVRLGFSLAEASPVQLRVFDIEGRLLVSEERTMSAGTQSMRVDVSDFAAGTYVYRISTPGADVRTGRFSVTR